MYAVEKKYEIEMKLKKEMSNIEQLKAAASRSSLLASDVCNVLGACEQRLQQLETAVLPLYGNTVRLQHIHQNMEKTVKSLDHVIDYYMVSRELADMIQAGPHNSDVDQLDIYIKALEKLAEAQKYFNEHNPHSVELENINQLYNTGVLKLEATFEEIVVRSTRPLSPTTIMDMIALEEDSSVESMNVSGSGAGGAGGAGVEEWVRAAAEALSACGRPALAALQAAHAPAVAQSVNGFIECLKRRDLAAPDPVARAKNLLHRSDSTKKTSKIQKVLEKRANKIMQKATQTIEQSTGLAIGSRKPSNDAYAESESEEWAVEAAGSVCACVCRVCRHTHAQVLGLVPLAKLPRLLAAVATQPLQILQKHVQRACERCVRAARRCGAGAAACWALAARLARAQPDMARALAPAPLQPYSNILAACTNQCVSTLDEWVEAVSRDASAPAVDGTVHQLAAAALSYLAALVQYSSTIGAALASEPAYMHATSQHLGVQDKDALLLAIYMRKLLATLNLALRTKSEQYADALKAIFLLNNTLYLLQGLQRSGLLDVLSLAEPECEKTYRDKIQEYKNQYLNSWNRLLAHLVLEEAPPAKLRDKDRQILKDKFAAFNRELEEASRLQRRYAAPDAELRETLKRHNKQTILPAYTRFYETYGSLPFSKNPDKYVKYTPVQVAAQLDGYFDEAA